MKFKFLSTALLLSAHCLFAQTDQAPPPPPPARSHMQNGLADSDMTASGERIVNMTDVQTAPKFPGGEEALFKYISSKLQYPQEARKKGIQGVVSCTFVVTRTGAIESAKILKGVDYGCGEEALRIIKAMPNWTPAVANGKPVNVRYVLPVRFKLT